MCLFLLQEEFRAAWEANQMLFILLPGFIPYLIEKEIIYIKTGTREMSRIENVLLYIVLVALLGFGVIRNVIH